MAHHFTKLAVQWCQEVIPIGHSTKSAWCHINILSGAYKWEIYSTSAVYQSCFLAAVANRESNLQLSTGNCSATKAVIRIKFISANRISVFTKYGWDNKTNTRARFIASVHWDLDWQQRAAYPSLAKRFRSVERSQCSLCFLCRLERNSLWSVSA